MSIVFFFENLRDKFLNLLWNDINRDQKVLDYDGKYVCLMDYI